MVHNDQPGTGTLIYPAGRFIAIAVTTCLGAAFVLWINGSVPFLSVPTLQLALWASGFAQSLAQEGWLAVHSTRLGLPEPAAISFGLAAAWPMSVLIRLGMHAADAYATVFAAWLLAAYAGAWVTAVRFGAAPVLATLGAACWLGMPVVWGHAPYTMLSLGIALLPLYFLALLRLLQPGASRANGAVGYLAVTLIAVFMDGYTFVFFASGAGALILYLFVFDPDRRRHLALFVVPWHLAAFAMAYVAYTGYVGTTSFGDHPLSVFRGLGLDLSFLLIPSAGVHWLADLLGWSVSRSDREFFGDWSTWSTTFAVPVMVVAVAAWRDARRHDGMATGLLLVAALGLYLALGPSVKFHSTKPESLQRQQLTEERIVRHMSPRFALGPTGNAWLWRHVPGFDSMRATYRWITLCVFACWLLVMLQASRQSAIAAGAIRWYFALSAIILVNLPGPNSAAHQGMRHRAAFLDIDTDLVARLKAETPAGAVVAFLPPGNDFLVNYLASGAGIRTYNIGGDKNNAAARRHWPQTLGTFGDRSFDADFAAATALLLARDEAERVVLPYFDLGLPDGRLPPEPAFRDEVLRVVEELEGYSWLTVSETPRWAWVAIDETDSMPGLQRLAEIRLRHCHLFEDCDRKGGNPEARSDSAPN